MTTGRDGGSFRPVIEAPFPVPGAQRRRPGLAYAMAAAAAVLWGINGAVSKTILSTGLSSERLAQVRSLGAALGLAAVVAVIAPRRLRLTRRELPYLSSSGSAGSPSCSGSTSSPSTDWRSGSRS